MMAKTDTDSATTEPKSNDPNRVFINVAIPIELHRRLRIRQITDGTVMRDVVTAALEAWLK